MQGLFVIFFLFFAASPCICTRITNEANPTYNVLDYGAKGDGHTDDTQAFLKAWDAACHASQGTPTLSIPKENTFMLQPLLFEGPCQSSTINFWVGGEITAPSSVDAWKWQDSDDKDKWIQFSDIYGLVFQGEGQIDGQGAPWWDCFAKNNDKCDERPSTLHFHDCQNLQIKGLNLVNSPRAHMRINGCNGTVVSNVHLVAPDESPNTDGINVSESSNVIIEESHIETGDDCIAINGGSSFINITGVFCGPGHGISVGSLGQGGSYEEVEEIHVKNCTFTGTQNGARIKTWQGGSGYARKITYEDIILEATENPVIIQQDYIDNKLKTVNAKAVEISDITFRNFRGTSADEIAVNLMCDKDIGCTNIVLDKINITSSDPGKTTTASCSNAHGESSSSNIPQVQCLSK